MKKILSLLGSVLFTVMVIVLVFLVFFVVKGKIDRDNVTKVAGYQLYIVLSGSMSPVFEAGSVVAIKPVDPQSVRTGDIITFKDPGDPNTIVTHRVLEVNEDGKGRSFITKGDANDISDPKPVPVENIVGRVTLSVPYAGYLLDFAKSKKGLLFFIVVPGAIFIITELIHLYRLALQAEEEEKKKKAEMAQAEAAKLGADG